MKNVSLYTFLLAAILCMTIVDVAAAVRYVKPTATGTGTGNSWANASGNLQAMIDASAVGDEVWVATGTYKPSLTPPVVVGAALPAIIRFTSKTGSKSLRRFCRYGNPANTAQHHRQPHHTQR